MLGYKVQCQKAPLRRMSNFIQKIKEILILSVFNILLPSADVYSDLYQAGRLYLGSPYFKCETWLDDLVYLDCIECLSVHYRGTSNCMWSHRNHVDMEVIKFPIFASLLIAPFLLNYILCWIAWYRLEKQKRRTWIAPLFACYPQLIAARTIHLLWTQPSEGVRQKRHLERNLMENEIFTEAVPSALTTTILVVITSLKNPYSRSIIGDRTMFLVTFATSVFTAGLGLAKCLLVGLNRC